MPKSMQPNLMFMRRLIGTLILLHLKEELIVKSLKTVNNLKKKSILKNLDFIKGSCIVVHTTYKEYIIRMSGLDKKPNASLIFSSYLEYHHKRS